MRRDGPRQGRPGWICPCRRYPRATRSANTGASAPRWWPRIARARRRRRSSAWMRESSADRSRTGTAGGSGCRGGTRRGSLRRNRWGRGMPRQSADLRRMGKVAHCQRGKRRMRRRGDMGRKRRKKRRLLSRQIAQSIFAGYDGA